MKKSRMLELMNDEQFRLMEFGLVDRDFVLESASLTKSAICVYLYFTQACNVSSGKTKRRNAKTIAKTLDMKVRAVYRGIAELVEKGWLKPTGDNEDGEVFDIPHVRKARNASNRLVQAKLDKNVDELFRERKEELEKHMRRKLVKDEEKELRKDIKRGLKERKEQAKHLNSPC